MKCRSLPSVRVGALRFGGGFCEKGNGKECLVGHSEIEMSVRGDSAGPLRPVL